MSLLETILAANLAVVTIVVLVQATQIALRKSHDGARRHAAHQTALSAEQILRASLLPGGRPPCPAGTKPWRVVNHAGKDYWLRIYRGPAEILPHNGSSAAEVQTIGVKAGDRVAGNDVLVLRQVDAPVAVRYHDASGGYFILEHSAGFRQGDIGVVCDNNVRALFQVTRVGNNGLRAAYSSGYMVRPGNCAAAFSVPGGCGSMPYTFDGAVVMRYRAVAFYIGNGHHKGDLSLFRKDLLLRRSSKKGVLAYMSSSEVLTGVRSLSAAVITRHGKRVEHRHVSTGGEALGLAVEIMIGDTSSAVSHPQAGKPVMRHAFSMAL